MRWARCAATLSEDPQSRSLWQPTRPQSHSARSQTAPTTARDEPSACPWLHQVATPGAPPHWVPASRLHKSIANATGLLLRSCRVVAVAKTTRHRPRCRNLPFFVTLRSTERLSNESDDGLGAADAAEICCPAPFPSGVPKTRRFMNYSTDFRADPRPGIAAGVADPARPRGLLPAGRQIRDDRPDLQPHHGAHPGPRGAPADQSVWVALQGDHRLEPGEDRPRGQTSSGSPTPTTASTSRAM